MLSSEDNEILCRVGKDTPMGQLFRRFWLPALLSLELPTPDCEPRRLRILGEDLVAFKDSEGRIGIVDAYCPHKLAPLYFGRNEESGLRCVYHGWKFGTDGKCLEIPNVPSTFNVEALKQKAAITAYPVREAGGMIWVYMGPKDKLPELPAFEWLGVPSTQNHVSRWLQRTNWAQGMEGEIDSSHVSWLHRDFDKSIKRPVNLTSEIPPTTRDPAPLLSVKETPYGLVYGARRKDDSGQYLWRVTQWYVPMFSQIPNNQSPRSGRVWVPIDDHNVMVYNYAYRTDRPYTQEEWDHLEEGPAFPPPREWRTVELEDGYVIDACVPTAQKENNYDLSRDRQKRVNFSGIKTITDQDRALQENMPSAFGLGPGKIVDRSREMLVPSDSPVVTARRILIKLAKDLAKGIEPAQPHDGQLYRALSDSAMTPHESFDDFLASEYGRFARL